jgi:tRNA pseudouridine38-40 synthase
MEAPFRSPSGPFLLQIGDNARMPRFRLTIEYEGTRYSGWQVQANARTVQGELLTAVRKAVSIAEVELYGAGRTDAGVHAAAQTAHLDVDTDLAPAALRERINDELPHDICILSIEEVPARFHARLHAISRLYLYQIARRRTAFGKRFVWWVRDPLDLAAMRAAAKHFVGMGDFRSFAQRRGADASTKVLVEEVRIVDAGDLILIRVRGSHFLWRMVRRMVGVLAEVGRGRLQPDEVASFLQQASGEPARVTAPPSGLFLERVFYPGEPIELPLEPIVPVTRVTHPPKPARRGRR